MRTNAEAELILLARKVESGASVTPMSIARVLSLALSEYSKAQPGSDAAFDANRLRDAIDAYRSR